MHPGAGNATKDETAVVRTRRLVLVPMSVAVMTAVLSEDWPAICRLVGAAFPAEWRADGWPWLSCCLAAAERDVGWTAWGPRLVLHGDEDGAPIVGEVGFHGRPDPGGIAEFGYSIAREYRRRGFAEEAVRALLRWAGPRPEVRTFRATIDPANAASLGLIRKLGFAEVGRRRHPARGEELVFDLPVSALR